MTPELQETKLVSYEFEETLVRRLKQYCLDKDLKQKDVAALAVEQLLKKQGY